MAINWSNQVNDKFYNVEISATENVIRTTFESGKTRIIQKNSISKKKFTFKLTIWNKAEEIAFWTWYDNQLKSGAESFLIENLLTKNGLKEYFLTSEVNTESTSYPKEFNFECEEA